MAFFWQAVLFVCIVVFIKLFFNSHPKMKILEVYSLPGKFFYLKYIFIVTLLSVRKFAVRLLAKNGLKPGYGVQSHESAIEMDKRQPLSSDSKAFDGVYLNGANRFGWHIIVGCGLRPHTVSAFIILKVPGVGLLLSRQLPDTELLRKEEDDSSTFSAKGLTITPIKPMRAWNLQFHGKMRLSHKPHKKVRVELEATWQSNLSIFNYDTQMPATNVAKALSREEWSDQYFKLLRVFHQTHYEQFGELNGSVIIDGVDLKMNMSTMRDHSFGPRREWRAFHRYVLHIFTLADGTCGNVGIICIPNVFSRLEIGYVYGKEDALDGAYDVDFDLYQHGEGGIPPTDYGFTFFAGTKYYEVKVHVEEWTELFLGQEWEAKIVESLCRFSINGLDGWGAVEWMYANSSGRPSKTVLTDL